jgi:hydrogenase 3 maturation protease
MVVGIGNRDGGDDAVGPYVIDQLRKQKTRDIEILDVGIAPENYTDVMKKKNPDLLLLIDAIDMGLAPGDIRKVDRDQIGEMHVSTHGIPLSVVMKYLEAFISQVLLIGIQPQRMQGPMSDIVRLKADFIIEQILSKNIQHFSQL